MEAVPLTAVAAYSVIKRLGRRADDAFALWFTRCLPKRLQCRFAKSGIELGLCWARPYRGYGLLLPNGSRFATPLPLVEGPAHAESHSPNGEQHDSRNKPVLHGLFLLASHYNDERSGNNA